MKKNPVVFVFLLSFLFLVCACSLFNSFNSNKNPDLTKTEAMKTVEKIILGTQESLKLTPSPTAIVLKPSDTPTPSPLPTSTEVLSTPTAIVTAVGLPCNQASFVMDVTIPDGMEMKPSQYYTKTWRIANSGTCAWNTSYQLVFSGGEQMGAPSTVNLPNNVQPGASTDISVQLLSPKSAGDYTGYFKIKAPDGVIFAMGAKNAPLSSVIKVVTATVSKPTESSKPQKGCGVYYNESTDMSSDGRFSVFANLVNTSSTTWNKDSFFIMPTGNNKDAIQDSIFFLPKTVNSDEEFYFETWGFDVNKGAYNFTIVWKLVDSNLETYCTFETPFYK